MTISFKADWEHLEQGSPAERACFAALGIKVDDTWLTEAEDSFVNRVRQQVHLSAYRFAEWLAWNWWRLRWEPGGAKRHDCSLAHHVTTVGGGYVWPNLVLFSDGERIALISRPTASLKQEPIRYLGEKFMIVRASEFVAALDLFMEQVLGQLAAENVGATNLEAIWDDVQAERADAGMRQWRQLEAMLGYDPGEAPEDAVKAIIDAGSALGERGFEELAAARKDGQTVPTANEIQKLAATYGLDAKPSDVVQLQGASEFGASADAPAWIRGAAAARALRDQEKLGDGHLSSVKLAALAGVSSKVIEPGMGLHFSFALDKSADAGRLVLRKTNWKTNRRFELARLLGDRIFTPGSEVFLPATRAQTYRQKWQRAFAAELLCPAAALIARIAGDVSSESIEAAAEEFEVADMVVSSLLVDHGMLDRDGIEARAAAA